MLFSAEYFRRRKRALKHAHHYLLINLRRGGKVCFLIVIVVNLERRRAAFGVASHERRCLELYKVLRLHAIAEALYYSLLNFKYLLGFFAAQCKRHMVEVGIEVNLAPQLERYFGFGNDFYFCNLQLDVAVLHA